MKPGKHRGGSPEMIVMSGLQRLSLYVVAAAISWHVMNGQCF